jgi:3-deoxy-manno-octulosonate cytidylyltransferase (CMP-KDO synthetase)
MDDKYKLGIIPARFASTRFPGKPLADLGGKPMIQRVYEQAKKANLDRVIVATDDERIREVVESFKGHVEMTDPNIPSGTDRCRAVLQNSEIEADWVVNIQGDEPFIDPGHINALIELLEKGAEIATLVSQAEEMNEVNNPNRVKVVRAQSGKALYFSRSAIPYNRSGNITAEDYFIHLGIYGFEADTLMELGELSTGKLENFESLEQLRWLENGYQIYTDLVRSRPDAVDTPEDLLLIQKKYFL